MLAQIFCAKLRPVVVLIETLTNFLYMRAHLVPSGEVKSEIIALIMP